MKKTPKTESQDINFDFILAHTSCNISGMCYISHIQSNFWQIVFCSLWFIVSIKRTRICCFICCTDFTNGKLGVKDLCKNGPSSQSSLLTAKGIPFKKSEFKKRVNPTITIMLTKVCLLNIIMSFTVYKEDKFLMTLRQVMHDLFRWVPVAFGGVY